MATPDPGTVRTLADTEERWPVESSRHVDDGVDWVVRLRADRVRRPGHRGEEPFTRLVLEHPGASIVLAVDDDERVVCVWQYRHAVGRTLVQLPAGLLDVEGEDPQEVARRELREEAGLEAASWTPLVSTYPSPGISAEVSHLFLARGLSQVGRGGFEPAHEEAEMELARVPFDELHAAALAGRLADAHLLTAVLTAAARGLAGSAAARE